MAIDPLKSHNLGLPDAARAGQAGTPAGRGEVAPAGDSDAPAQRDSVELSSESRQLGESAAAGAPALPSGSLTAERLREVAARIEAGFYDAPAVRDRVAERLASDLNAG